MPSGCSKQGRKMSEAYSNWRGDEKGRRSATLCKERGAAFDHWCGSTGTQMLFVPEQPTKPGCYAWRPLGCPRQQTDAYDTWRGDAKGGKSFGTCKEREEALDHWCGSTGTRMLFIPKVNVSRAPEKLSEPSSKRATTPLPQNSTTFPTVPELPKVPGCYAWMPSGCSKQGLKMSEAYSNWR